VVPASPTGFFALVAEFVAAGTSPVNTVIASTNIFTSASVEEAGYMWRQDTSAPTPLRGTGHAMACKTSTGRVVGVCTADAPAPGPVSLGAATNPREAGQRFTWPLAMAATELHGARVACFASAASGPVMRLRLRNLADLGTVVKEKSWAMVHMGDPTSFSTRTLFFDPPYPSLVPGQTYVLSLDNPGTGTVSMGTCAFENQACLDAFLPQAATYSGQYATMSSASVWSYAPLTLATMAPGFLLPPALDLRQPWIDWGSGA